MWILNLVFECFLNFVRNQNYFAPQRWSKLTCLHQRRKNTISGKFSFFLDPSKDVHDGADILRNLFSLEFDFKILNNIIVILSKNVPSLDCRCCQRHFNVSNLYLMITAMVTNYVHKSVTCFYLSLGLTKWIQAS